MLRVAVAGDGLLLPGGFEGGGTTFLAAFDVAGVLFLFEPGGGKVCLLLGVAPFTPFLDGGGGINGILCLFEAIVAAPPLCGVLPSVGFVDVASELAGRAGRTGCLRSSPF